MKTEQWLKMVRTISLLRKRAAKDDNPFLLDALDRAAFEAGWMLGLSIKDEPALR